VPATKGFTIIDIKKRANFFLALFCFTSLFLKNLPGAGTPYCFIEIVVIEYFLRRSSF